MERNKKKNIEQTKRRSPTLSSHQKKEEKNHPNKETPALTPKQLQFLRKTGPILGRAISSSEKIRKNVLGIS